MLCSTHRAGNAYCFWILMAAAGRQGKAGGGCSSCYNRQQQLRHSGFLPTCRRRRTPGKSSREGAGQQGSHGAGPMLPGQLHPACLCRPRTFDLWAPAKTLPLNDWLGGGKVPSGGQALRQRRDGQEALAGQQSGSWGSWEGRRRRDAPPSAFPLSL